MSVSVPAWKFIVVLSVCATQTCRGPLNVEAANAAAADPDNGRRGSGVSFPREFLAKKSYDGPIFPYERKRNDAPPPPRSWFPYEYKRNVGFDDERVFPYEFKKRGEIKLFPYEFRKRAASAAVESGVFPYEWRKKKSRGSSVFDALVKSFHSLPTVEEQKQAIQYIVDHAYRRAMADATDFAKLATVTRHGRRRRR